MAYAGVVAHLEANPVAARPKFGRLGRCALGLVLLFSTALGAWLGSQSAGASRGGTRELPGLRVGLDPSEKMTAYVDRADFAKVVAMYQDLTGRQIWPDRRPLVQRLDSSWGNVLTRTGLLKLAANDTGISYHRDGRFSVAEIKEQLESWFQERGWRPVGKGARHFELVRSRE